MLDIMVENVLRDEAGEDSQRYRAGYQIGYRTKYHK